VRCHRNRTCDSEIRWHRSKAQRSKTIVKAAFSPASRSVRRCRSRDLELSPGATRLDDVRSPLNQSFEASRLPPASETPPSGTATQPFATRLQKAPSIAQSVQLDPAKPHAKSLVATHTLATQQPLQVAGPHIDTEAAEPLASLEVPPSAAPP
jgi:hypothetical protein